jgi:hypothetical protein
MGISARPGGAEFHIAIQENIRPSLCDGLRFLAMTKAREHER